MEHRDGRAGGSAQVSVVVIFRDEEAFLDEAVASIYAQTFPSWELLLVDDGSVDGSTAVARDYAQRDPRRVRYVTHPGHANLGMSATRNLGIAQATGELLAFLDADDVLHPFALDEQVAVLREHPRAGVVYGPLEYWYSWTGAREDRERDFMYPLGVPPDRLYEPPSLLAPFLQDTAFAPSGMVSRRALVEQVGGFEPAFRNLYEDQVFAAKLALAAPIYVSSRCWYRYRQHADSCCLTAQRDGRLDAAREPFLCWLVQYLEEQGHAGNEAWRVATEELASQSWRRPNLKAHVARDLARVPRALGARRRRGRTGR